MGDHMVRDHMRARAVAFLLGILAGIVTGWVAMSRTQAVAIRETVSSWMQQGLLDAQAEEVPGNEVALQRARAIAREQAARDHHEDLRAQVMGERPPLSDEEIDQLPGGGR